jgi:hypothetical protein
MWQHHVFVCALFPVQRGMWTGYSQSTYLSAQLVHLLVCNTQWIFKMHGATIKIKYFRFWSHTEPSNWLAAFWLLFLDTWQDTSCRLSDGHCNFYCQVSSVRRFLFSIAIYSVSIFACPRLYYHCFLYPSLATFTLRINDLVKLSYRPHIFRTPFSSRSYFTSLLSSLLYSPCATDWKQTFHSWKYSTNALLPPFPHSKRKIDTVSTQVCVCVCVYTHRLLVHYWQLLDKCNSAIRANLWTCKYTHTTVIGREPFTITSPWR